MLPKEQCLNNLQKKRFDGRMKMFIQTLYAASLEAISGLSCSFPTEAFEVYELLEKRKQFLLLSRKFAQSLHIAFVYKGKRNEEMKVIQYLISDRYSNGSISLCCLFHLFQCQFLFWC